MQDYVIEVRRTLIQMTLWGLFVGGSAFVAGMHNILPGLALGTVTSMIYFLLMCYRVKKSSTMPVHKAIAYMRAGWLVRLAFLVLMLVLAVSISDIQFFGAAIVGLFSLHIVILFNAVVLVVQEVINPKKLR